MICAVCETQTQVTPCAECGNDPLLAGTYRLERILGRGAQGTTFLAAGPHGVCAIKELQLGRSAGGKTTELFHREAAVLAQLDHDSIPDLYHHFVDGIGVARSLYLVQQFIPGQNLEERLNSHRYSEAEVLNVVTQVAEILAYLHTLHPPVIHRDIKPSNLIIDDEGRVHLIDFGAVRDVMRDTVGGGSTVAGTFGYMAPEQLVGDATQQSDLYALGMTALQLLTRQTPAAVTDRSGNVDWSRLTNVESSTVTLLDGLTRHHVSERVPTAHALLGALHNPPTPMPPPAEAVPAQLAIHHRRHRWSAGQLLVGRTHVRHQLRIQGHLNRQDVEDIREMGISARSFASTVTLRNGGTMDATDERSWYTWQWTHGWGSEMAELSATPQGPATVLETTAGSPFMRASFYLLALLIMGLPAALIFIGVPVLSNSGLEKELAGFMTSAAVVAFVMLVVRALWFVSVQYAIERNTKLLQAISNEFVPLLPDTSAPQQEPDKLPMEAPRQTDATGSRRTAKETG